MLIRSNNDGARRIEIVGVASGLGGPDPACASGPQALRDAGLVERLGARGVHARWHASLEPASAVTGDPFQAIGELCDRLGATVARIVASGGLPLVLGGDHSTAVGTWRGVAAALPAGQPLGLLWIDAHLDSHTTESTPSGNAHGMPLAALLGYGDRAWTAGSAAQPALDPARVCVIGARSYEAAELELLQRLGVRIYHMDEVAARGLGTVLREARQKVAANGERFGISLDVDALDPGAAPGVSCPAAGGLEPARLEAALADLLGDPDLACFEIAELNPRTDREGRTLEVLLAIASRLAPAATAPISRAIELERRYGARNYAPLPVVLARGKGARVWDEQGREYLDLMSAYSAVSHGHSHPRLVSALVQQAATLAVTSRAYHNDKLPRLLERLAEITGLPKVLPVNTGLEAVETALKAARKWAYRVKGVPEGRAEIVACAGNFHGRSLAIVSMSTEAQYKDGFGPLLPGFRIVPFGDAAALERAIGPHTAAFIVEPIQGEGGVIVPPAGYLAQCARICRSRNVLLILDEIQTGFGRTGELFAFRHDKIVPDGLVLGKALGGGLLPVSAFVARDDVMAVFSPGDHGSTFGGNPLAARVAVEAIETLLDERLVERSAKLGAWLMEELRRLESPLVREVRGRGLLIGIELDPELCSARQFCERLMRRGLLSKDTHETVVRIAPPLVVTRRQLEHALAQIRATLEELEAECCATA